MARVAVAMMWLLMAGTMCRRMTRFLVAPSTSEASTKSSSRSARKRPRTSRARVVQAKNDRITVIAR